MRTYPWLVSVSVRDIAQLSACLGVFRKCRVASGEKVFIVVKSLRVDGLPLMHWCIWCLRAAGAFNTGSSITQRTCLSVLVCYVRLRWHLGTGGMFSGALTLQINCDAVFGAGAPNVICVERWLLAPRPVWESAVTCVRAAARNDSCVHLRFRGTALGIFQKTPVPHKELVGSVTPLPWM